jgi:hypothetical protein
MISSLRFHVTAILAVMSFSVLSGNSVAGTIYVDGTFTGLVSDGSLLLPYKTIGDGIGGAAPGDTVKVFPGVYEENVVISKNNLTLSGTGPDTTVVKGKAGTTMKVSANVSCGIEGMTVTGSTTDGIYITPSSSATSITIKNVVSVANTRNGFYQPPSDAVTVLASNCTLVGNAGDGVKCGSSSVFRNCIAASNGASGFYSEASGCPSTIYCDAYGNSLNNYECGTPATCKSANPLFVDPDTGDYRLQSGSLCRNAGSPDAADRNPDGSRNDMGAYGGPAAAGFFNGYGSGPVVTDLFVTPGAVPIGGTFSIEATGKAQ